jgi:hypothetical protein
MEPAGRRLACEELRAFLGSFQVRESQRRQKKSKQDHADSYPEHPP